MADEFVKLIITCIYSDSAQMKIARNRLEELWGPIDYMSPVFAFDMTDYYTAEMGAKLHRIFFSFENKISPEYCADLKITCATIETDFLRESGGRSVNLDPGYMDTFKYVLLSFKKGGQKIFLHDGVWADMTLMYRKGKWIPFPWTFPDFTSDRYYSELSKIRELLKIKK